MPTETPASAERPPEGLPADEPSYLAPGHSFRTVTDKISSIVLTRPIHPAWLICFTINFGLLMVLLFGIVYLLAYGVGIWGIDIPVACGFAINNFVWWIGIGHAGTLISAILLLMHQKWRTSINRLAEAMTIFAVMCAGVFPLLHLGRPWFFYWLVPYPNTMGLWPQFRSALVWDVFAVSTYFTVSLLFWYMGMIPDLATLRDRAPSRLGQIAYGFLAMGWRNSARHWQRYEAAYLILGGLATPLVVSVVVLQGMWLERFMIIVTSLHRDFLPSSWGMFKPTLWDYLTFFGTLGLFFVLFLLFIRLLPMISIAEMRALLPGTHAHEE